MILSELAQRLALGDGRASFPQRRGGFEVRGQIPAGGRRFDFDNVSPQSAQRVEQLFLFSVLNAELVQGFDQSSTSAVNSPAVVPIFLWDPS